MQNDRRVLIFDDEDLPGIFRSILEGNGWQMHTSQQHDEIPVNGYILPQLVLMDNLGTAAKRLLKPDVLKPIPAIYFPVNHVSTPSSGAGTGASMAEPSNFDMVIEFSGLTKIRAY